jgi:glycosyltransferase involved in cell wall biosynthesis
LKEWEAILVDDGSPDSCGQICDEYAARDCRFQVIHQQNAGVSAARQAGLEVVSGEYVIHADPDDWVEPMMLEELYKKAKADDADMMICDLIADIGDKSYYRQQRPRSLDSSVVLHNMFDDTIHGSCCNKLVRWKCIEQYGAFFPAGINYCEDVCFNVQLLIHDIKVSYLNKAFYHYVQYPTSLTNAYTKDTLETQIKYISFLSEQLPEDSFPVIRSKELVKKLAFRNALLADKEFETLYPEIKTCHDDKWLVALMYKTAFTGHFVFAKLLRKIYRVHLR